MVRRNPDAFEIPKHTFSIPPPSDAETCLGSTILFEGLGAEGLRAAAAAVQWLLIPGGVQLLEVGDVVDSLFIVASGRLRLFTEGSSTQREIGRGECLGELSLLTGEPWPATVHAVRDTVVARLPGDRFDGLTARYPGLAMQLARMLAGRPRLSASAERPLRHLGTLAVIPLSWDAPVAQFTAQLARALMAHAPVLHLDATRVDAHLGPDAAEVEDSDPRYAETTSWINEQEGRRLVVYESSSEPSAWSRRCIRQADRVLAVALADGGPQDSRIAPLFLEAAAHRGGVQIELVLMHEDGALRPVASHPWATLHPFTAHHHVRLRDAGDFARLARWLTGRSTGLVLGGGGARSYAHIGVIRALREAGVPIDWIGGTSAGALIAAQYAYGYDCDAMVEINRQLWRQRRRFTDTTLPLIALRSGRGSKRALERFFGDVRIEDMWLPFFCVSANLTRAQLVVHRVGPVARWVRASLSIPGILPPVVSDEGDLLVDGAMLNNVPVDVMRETGVARIIAVDVTPMVDLRPRPGCTDVPTAGQLLRARLRTDDAAAFPTIFKILLRATLLPSMTLMNRVRGDADLYLRLPVAEFDMFAWTALEKIVAVGYTYACRALAEWEGIFTPGFGAVPGTFKMPLASSGGALTPTAKSRPLPEMQLRGLPSDSTRP